jgi:hypothetical protein
MSRLVCAVAAAALLAPAAFAEPPHGGGHGYAGHGYVGHAYAGHAYGGPHFAGPHFVGHGPVVFRGRAFGRMTPYESGVWRGGHWWRGWRGTRYGWWWWADGGWYWYDTPVYPYPTVISETVYMDAPPGVNASGGYTWWYCDNPQGYWPYVRACAGPWQAVTPPPPPQ